MYDKGKILAGIALFLVLVLFPVWYGAAQGGPGRPPDLVVGTDAESCVRDTETMRISHMDLLDEWRNRVVRDGVRRDEVSGREMSLTRTCLDCHADREGFCTKCHDYAGVDPDCWDCHNLPEGAGHER